MKNATVRFYPEIAVPINRTKEVQLPDHCPECGAAAEAPPGDNTPAHWHGRHYSCGGAYAIQPQIQNTWQKWGGSCGTINGDA